MDPKLQILIENINILCRFWRSNQFCRRANVDTFARGIPSDFEEPTTLCEGRILKCERIPEELFRDPPL